MFKWDIYGTFWLRTAEFDGDIGDVAIIDEFDFYGVWYDAFTVGVRRFGVWLSVRVESSFQVEEG